MRKYAMIAFFLSNTLLMLGCSTKKQTSASVVKQPTNTAVTTIENPLATVYADYIGIKNSLTKDNGDSAMIFAKLLYKAVDDLKMDKLTPTQHTAWMKYMKDLSYHAEHIKGTAALEHQREHFIELSKVMYLLVKAFDSNTGDVYYQFCPMANNGKGAYWLSENSKIVNPYFGKKMLNCGSTKETIVVK